jgi:hypothetical protein
MLVGWLVRSTLMTSTTYDMVIIVHIFEFIVHG